VDGEFLLILLVGLDLKYKLEEEPSITVPGLVKFVNLTVMSMMRLAKPSPLIAAIIRLLM